MIKKKEKAKYEKPELKSIQLHADEVLAGSCKTSSDTLPGATGGCGSLPTPCSSNGS